MSITNELRECIRTANRSYEDTRNPFNDREILHIAEEELLGIADRIDTEHERMYKDLTIGMEPMTDENMARDGWVKLPADAEGVPIEIGDYLHCDETGKDFPCRGYCCSVGKDGERCWTVECCYDPYSGTSEYVSARRCHHVKPDSWVRIIGDAMSFEGDGWYSTRDDAMAELVERCRRLAGDAG